MLFCNLHVDKAKSKAKWILISVGSLTHDFLRVLWYQLVSNYLPSYNNSREAGAVGSLDCVSV